MVPGDEAMRRGRGDVEYYMSGACPLFALASHEVTGWPLAMLVDEGREWESFGAERRYPFIAHVFVLTPDGDVFDAKGVRKLKELKDEFHDVLEPRIERLTQKELRALMGDFRPLCRYSTKDVKEAEKLVRKMVVVPR